MIQIKVSKSLEQNIFAWYHVSNTNEIIWFHDLEKKN